MHPFSRGGVVRGVGWWGVLGVLGGERMVLLYFIQKGIRPVKKLITEKRSKKT